MQSINKRALNYRAKFKPASASSENVYKFKTGLQGGTGSVQEEPARFSFQLNLPLFTFLSVIIILAIGGAFLANQMLAPTNGVALRGSTFQVGQEIKTSFGVLVIEHVDEVDGLSAADLAGNTHGIQNYITPDKVQIQTFVRFTNNLSRPVNYSPEQFQLKTVKNPEPMQLFGASIRPGTLQPGASINATLSFVTTRDGSNLWIEYQDPVFQEPIYIDLGAVDNHPEKDTTGHNTHP
jgi:hypothetical protein